MRTSVVLDCSAGFRTDLPFPFLADTSGAICDSFGVKHPKNQPQRETFLLRAGKLVRHDRAVNPARQAYGVLRKIEERSRQLPQ